jgi:hypothetical protein
MAGAERDGSDVVRTLGQLIGLAAGLLALLYAAGGGVLTLRLYLMHLPSRTVAAQLPRDLLISIGLAQIILPILAVAGLYATLRLLLGSVAPPTRLVREWTERSLGGWLRLVAASALPAIVFTLALWIGISARNIRGGANGLAWLLPLAFLLTLLFVLVGLNLRARLVKRYGESPHSWSTPRPVFLMTLIIALVCLPVFVLVAGAFFPLLDAKVCTASGAESSGLLIGETSARTYIGQKAKKAKKAKTAKKAKADMPLLVFSIPQSEIKQTIIGGNAVARWCPAATSRAH